MDTSLMAPNDIVEPNYEEPIANPLSYEVAPRSVVLFIGK
jgi:hypothetical protein